MDMLEFDEAQFKGTKKAYPKMAEGWHRVRAISASKRATKNGHLGISLTLARVDDGGNTTALTLRHLLVLPVKTPASFLTEQGLPADIQPKIPNTAGLVTSYIEATFPNALPKKQRIAKINNEWVEVDETKTPTGNPAGPREARDTVDGERATLLKGIMQRAYENPESLIGERDFFVKVKYTTAEDGKEYVNGDRFSSTEPAEGLVAQDATAPF